MGNRLNKIVEMCGLEDDVDIWKRVGSKLFNGLDHPSLCNWHSNRDAVVRELVFEKRKNTLVYNENKYIYNYFIRGSDGRLITKEPLFVTNLTDKVS